MTKSIRMRLGKMSHLLGYVIMKQADNRIGTTSKGEPWYGLLNFQFASVERVYRAAPLTVTCKVYKHGYEKAPQGAAHVIVSNPGALPVDYTFTISPASDPIQTTRAADGSFMLTGLPLFQLTNGPLLYLQRRAERYHE